MGCSLISIVEIFYFLIRSGINFLKPKYKVNPGDERKMDVRCIEESSQNTNSLEIIFMINNLKEKVEKLNTKFDIVTTQLRNVDQRLENVEKFILIFDDD